MFRRLRKTKIIVIIVLVILVAGVGFAVYKINQPEFNATDKPAETKKTVDSFGVTITDTEIAKASQYATSGDIDKAVDIYSKNIDNAKDDKQKSEENLKASDSLMGGDNVSKDNIALALKYALEAEKLDPTAETAARLASIYQQMGDTVNSAKYYKIVDDRLPPVDRFNGN